MALGDDSGHGIPLRHAGTAPPAGVSRTRMDDVADPPDVFQQRAVSDVGQRLHFEPIRQGQFIQDGGDRSGAQGVDLAGHDPVHIGGMTVGSLGPRTENRGRCHLGMTHGPETSRPCLMGRGPLT